MKEISKRIVFSALIVCLLMCSVISCRKREEINEESSGAIETSAETDVLLKKYQENYPEPTIVVESTDAKAGDEIEISVYVVHNPGILGMSATISYDESMLTLLSAENGDIVENILDLTSSADLQNGSRFLWDGVEINENQIQDGKILNLTFRVEKTVKNGKYPIALILDESGIFDNDLNQIQLKTDLGYVTVK